MYRRRYFLVIFFLVSVCKCADVVFIDLILLPRLVSYRLSPSVLSVASAHNRSSSRYTPSGARCDIGFPTDDVSHRLFHHYQTRIRLTQTDQEANFARRKARGIVDISMSSMVMVSRFAKGWGSVAGGGEDTNVDVDSSGGEDVIVGAGCAVS